MIAQIRSETYKLLTTRTNAGVLVTMVGLVTLAVLLHAFGLPLDQLASGDQQRGLLSDVGVNLGVLFAALLGALAITAEYRTGTIRPVLLITPRRARVVAAKALVALAAGAATGLLAGVTAVVAGIAGMSSRGLTVEVSSGEVTRLVIGAAGGGALWAVIGLGAGALTRSQVPTVVGLFVWLLFIEQVLLDFPDAHRFVPGALAQSLAGSTRDGVLASALLAAVLLVGYAAAAAVAGLAATARRDVG